MVNSPRRIVCLSAEAADWLFRIGAWALVAGVTAFFEPPPGCAPKPRVSGFSSGNLIEIEKLKPDLVIAFSDVQADLAAELIRRGLPVFATNQRTILEIEKTLAMLGGIVGRTEQSEKLLREFRERLQAVEAPSQRPRVYFEEWNEPMIAGIAWVSELIERTGGQDVFGDLRFHRAAKHRAVTSEQVLAADPEIILVSWCGKPADIPAIGTRAGWKDISAVRESRIFEIPAADILQPGFRLIHGYDRIKQIIAAAH